MGVHGLWRLIEPSGKPVPLESLENKVLAVDISIWLHQAVKGFQDSKGAPVPNAHLLGIYHRVCKLLYFKIKPVFVFDGGVPALKKQTIAKRNQLKSKNTSEADRLQNQLLNTLLKHTAISKVLSEKTKASLTAHTKKSHKRDNLYELPPTAEADSTISSDDDETESTSDTTDSSPTKNWDLHTIDMNSSHFKSLPVDVRHEILTELKETRKQNSWGRLHEIPKQSDNFSSYQMKRLLKRQSVQAALDEAAKEMGGMSLSLAELESILKDQGIKTTTDNIGKRIASDENTRYLFIKDVKQAIEKARQEQIQKESKTGQGETVEPVDSVENSEEKNLNKADLEEEQELQRAIALSLQEVPTTSSSSDTPKKIEFSFLENFNDEDFQSESDEEAKELPLKKVLSSAQNYMMEYSGLTPNEISKIISVTGQKKSKFSNKEPSEKVISSNSKIEIITEAKVVSDNTNQKEGVHKDNVCEIMSDSEESCKNDFVQAQDKDSKINETGTQKTTGEHIKALGEVCEIMSDSESSSSSDFVDVVIKDSKNSMEIVIDPDKNIDEDDLFGDIFVKEQEVGEEKKMEITIKPHSNLDDNLFSKEEADMKKIANSSVDEYWNTKIAEPDANLTDKSTTKEIPNEPDETQVDKTKNESVEVIQKPVTPQLSIQEMTDLRDTLQREKTDLMIEKSNKERLAGNITDQMYQEAQELLELFGVPYVIAPMEAEAQCAFLDEMELTDGTITDDSDIWLFGGKSVYKNFFNQSKYVLEFKAENIKHHFKLTREQMILLALLVGSDYTTGIQGVGPVTALEILAAFPPSQSSEFSLSHAQLISGLKEFRSWFTKGRSGGPGRASLKSKLKNVTFTENFPSLQVIQAYLDPKVETSKEKFSWGKPDVVSLSLFAKEKFGWGSKKTDEILKPVIKRLEENRSQKCIKEYFKTKFKVDSGTAAEKMSRRVRTAVERFGKTQEELIAEEMEELEKQKHKISKTKSDKRAVKKGRKSKIENLGDAENGAQKKESSEDKHQKTLPEPKTESGNAGRSGIEEMNLPKRERRKKAKNGRINIENLATSSNGNGKNLVTLRNETETNGTKIENTVDSVDDLKTYEDLAAAIRLRRLKRDGLIKAKKEEPPMKKIKIPPQPLVEDIPKDLETDEDIQFLVATSSRSLTRAEEVNEAVKKDLDKHVSVRRQPNLHTKEIIHQKLRDKTDLLKNKMKAIEVFRKSKKGPGYVHKRKRLVNVPKEDAGLSEDSE